MFATMAARGNYESEPELVRQDGETSAVFQVNTHPTQVEEMRVGPSDQQAGQAIWALAGWMHFAGMEMDISLEDPDGSRDCMLGIRQWDSDWLRSYRIDGDIADLPVWESNQNLHLKCTYDNTDVNENLSERLEEEGISSPVTMSLGSGTLDENCLAIIGLVDR